MPYYPQLASGSIAHYPLQKTIVTRTVINEGLDGSRVSYADSPGSTVEWQIEYRGLNGAEKDALEAFFRDCEGRLQSFVFADPVGNLLARSEEFDEAPWASDPQLQWTGSISDPFGGTGAMRVLNVGSIAQKFEQQVDLPGTYQLCFSMYIRTDSPVNVVLGRSAGAQLHESSINATDTWRRVSLSGSLSTAVAPVRFQVSVPAGASIDVFGAQGEPQPIASFYRKTLAVPGLFPAARFAEDELNVVAESVDSFASRAAIRSLIGG
jgi:hypothetical protein